MDQCEHFFIPFFIDLSVLGINWEVRPPAASHAEQSAGGIPHKLTINKSIANVVILRGLHMETADPTSFSNRQLYTGWTFPSTSCSFWCHSKPFNQYEKSATLLSNSQTPVASLKNVAQKAWNMFASRAYVHQYLRYGSTEDDFVDSFASVEQVIKNYSLI